jgi:hypothetical protein
MHRKWWWAAYPGGVFEVGLASLCAAQVLGIVGLRRPGYELLCAIAMFTLALPLLLMALVLVLTF